MQYVIISYKYVSHKKKWSHPDAINYAPMMSPQYFPPSHPGVLGHPDHMAALFFSTSMRFTPGDGHRIVPRCHEHGVQRSHLG